MAFAYYVETLKIHNYEKHFSIGYEAIHTNSKSDSAEGDKTDFSASATRRRATQEARAQITQIRQESDT